MGLWNRGRDGAASVSREGGTENAFIFGDTMKWIVLGAIASVIAALWILEWRLVALITMTVAAIVLLVFTWRRELAPHPLYYCASCGRCLGNREEGVDIPCPECGGREYFTFEKSDKVDVGREKLNKE